jgi:hypothetical protein
VALELLKRDRRALGTRCDNAESHVVTRALILAAWITKPHNQPLGGPCGFS